MISKEELAGFSLVVCVLCTSICVFQDPNKLNVCCLFSDQLSRILKNTVT